MPRRIQNDGKLPVGYSGLPITTDVLGNAQPSGLDMMRMAEGAQAAELQRMEMQSKDELQQAAKLSYFRQKGLIAQDPRIQAIQEKAKFDAQIFEKRYTEKQKIDISRIRSGQQSAHNNPNFSESDLIAVDKAADLKVLGISPAYLPRLSPHPVGRGPGEPFDVPNGGTWMMSADGSRYQQVSTWKGSPQQQAMQDARKEELDKHNALTTFMNAKIRDAEGNTRLPNSEEIRNFQIRQNGYDAVKRQEVTQQRLDAGLPEVPGSTPNAPTIHADLSTPSIPGQTVAPANTAGSFNDYYNSLDTGTKYLGPDGKWRIKK